MPVEIFLPFYLILLHLTLFLWRYPLPSISPGAWEPSAIIATQYYAFSKSSSFNKTAIHSVMNKLSCSRHLIHPGPPGLGKLGCRRPLPSILVVITPVVSCNYCAGRHSGSVSCRIKDLNSRSCCTLFWGNATSFVDPASARQFASSYKGPLEIFPPHVGRINPQTRLGNNRGDACSRCRLVNKWHPEQIERGNLLHCQGTTIRLVETYLCSWHVSAEHL
ncbi:hypothetical protein GGI35DRAFT_162912 [Trichoderma velutinum]